MALFMGGMFLSFVNSDKHQSDDGKYVRSGDSVGFYMRATAALVLIAYAVLRLLMDKKRPPAWSAKHSQRLFRLSKKEIAINYSVRSMALLETREP